MNHQPFPDGPYYAWHIEINLPFGWPNMQWPSIFKPYMSQYGVLRLTGSEIKPQMVEAILDQFRLGKLWSLYLTPFCTPWKYSDDRSQMYKMWENTTYTHGCGALVFNQEHSIAWFRRLDKDTLHRKTPLEAGYVLPVHPPIIYETNEEVAKAVGNLILTGIPNETGTKPPATSKTRRGVDPSLLFWLENVLGFVPQSLADLRNIRELTATNFVPGYPKFPDWLAPEPGNWSLLEELSELSVLVMPKLQLKHYEFLLHYPKLSRLDLSQTNLSNPAMLLNLSNLEFLELPPEEFKDFSFLLSCKKLQSLDVSRTDFRDCSILMNLKYLRRVLLPGERQLLHLDVLGSRLMEVKTHPGRMRGSEIPLYERIEPRPIKPWDFSPPYKALSIDCGAESEPQPEEMDEELIQDLIDKIHKNRLGYIVVSPNYWEPEAYLTIFTNNFDEEGYLGTVVIIDPDERVKYYILNPDCPNDDNEVPSVMVDYHTPALKMHVISDSDLVAQCVAYYIKTCEPYPGAYWAKYYYE